MHVEYQLQPNPSVMPGWLIKTGALTRQLGIRVILVVFYLERGSYASFPSTFITEAGGLKNEFSFPIIRLWEHANRHRSGDLQELAPLLALCEDRPTEQTLREEREIILGLDTTPEVRAELLAVALTVGLRYFTRDLLEGLFREELRMLKEVDFIRELFSDEFAEAEARGEARRARDAAAAAQPAVRRAARHGGQQDRAAGGRLVRRNDCSRGLCAVSGGVGPMNRSSGSRPA
jgi:hypothetical protein